MVRAGSRDAKKSERASRGKRCARRKPHVSSAPTARRSLVLTAMGNVICPEDDAGPATMEMCAGDVPSGEVQG
jgi:hypothetical protein